jgi:hypothetical protein
LTEVDLEGHFDEATQIEYLGKAKLQPNGKWHCLANVRGALCMVEVTITFAWPKWNFREPQA